MLSLAGGRPMKNKDSLMVSKNSNNLDKNSPIFQKNMSLISNFGQNLFLRKSSIIIIDQKDLKRFVIILPKIQ